ncbi:SIR2 family protein [Leuconostocaceae bacterium ESL0723]|nr:SIR2 family protein [Leuconostocaceae bacterium ESL0723]
MDEEKKQYKIYESGFEANNFELKDSNDIQIYLKNILPSNTNLNILIGSGCSLPAVPTMNNTFNELKVNNPKISTLIEIYKDSSLSKENDPNAENIELFLSWLGNRIDGLSQNELSNNEPEVRKSIIEALISSIVKGSSEHDDFSDENNKSNSKFQKTLQTYITFLKNLAFIKQLSNDQNDIINIFTPNYDLFIESALDSLGYSYTDGFRNSVHPSFDTTEYNRRPVDITKRFRDRWSIIKPFFRVYKLHGSLDWTQDKSKAVFKNTNVQTRKISELAEAVIAPTSSKYADSLGSPFSDLFREFSIELTRSNSILLINGYGFGDEHINDFIIQALGRPDFKLIVFLNENERNAKNFMMKVGNAAGATFITNSKNGKDAHYFSTVTNLLKYNNPFEKDDGIESSNDKDINEDE